MKRIGPLFIILLAVFCGGFTSNQLMAQSYTFDQIAGLEGTTPSFWNIGNQPSGSTLTWATDQFVSMGHSIKIEKSTTTDSASWVSDNMCDIWSGTIPANKDLLFGAWIKTQNVNTNPTSDDQRWWISYSFYDSAGALIGTVKLPVDQSTASSSGWMADTTAVGQVSLPKDAWKMIISFVGGKNATGTVWADNFIFLARDRNDWAGQDWNTQLGVPTGWYYWLPPNGGNDGTLNDGFENTVVTNETSHSGSSSLKFVLPADRQVHDGFVSTHRLSFDKIDPNIKPGSYIRISVWIKASGLVPDSAAKYPSTWAVGITPQFFPKVGNNDGFDGSGSDYQFKFPNVTAFDWTQYYVDVQVPVDKGSTGMEVRLHVYSQFVGTIYFDDLAVTKLSLPSFADLAGFEGTTPAFWNFGNQPVGSTLTWATDQYVSMGHSIKIAKSATSDSASWVSDNMCDIWSGTIPANKDLLFGAWIKTQDVNTNPTSDDQRWWIAYTFYDSAGALIGTVKLPIDQSSATSNNWVADTTTVGQISLPKDAWKMIISFVGGKNAIGTVWADNFIFLARDRKDWAGQDWNTQLGVPTGWYYWLPPNGGNDGKLLYGFENTLVTNEAAHSGSYSLKFNLPAGRDVHDGFVGTHRQLFSYIDSTIKPGDYLRISVWIKASGLVPDSAAKYPSTWAVGITPQFFPAIGNNDGYAGSGSDYQFVLPSVTSFDWTQFHVDVQVPTDQSSIGMETRLHVYSQFVGTVYFDDLSIQNLGLTAVQDPNKLLPTSFTVFQNYPNPFNPTTTISYSLPKEVSVKVIVYDMLGREVKTLVNTNQKAGVQNVIWNGDNNFGHKVSSGIYMYKVAAGEQVQVKKMIMLK